MKKIKIIPMLIAASLTLTAAGCGNQQAANSAEIEEKINALENKLDAIMAQVSDSTEPTEADTEERELSDSEKQEVDEIVEHNLAEAAIEETDAYPNVDDLGEDTTALSLNIPESELSEAPLLFQTTDLDGNAVTSDIFMDYDITILHIWGTYCGPCIEEMDKYAKFYDSIPGNINLVGLVVDVYDGYEDNVDYAKEILGSAGADFQNLRTSESLYELEDEIDYIPSSVLVDRSGRIIGEILEGESFEATRERLNEYIG